MKISKNIFIIILYYIFVILFILGIMLYLLFEKDIFIYCVKHDKIYLIEIMLNFNSELSTINVNNELIGEISLVHFAAIQKNEKIAIILLKHNADIAYEKNGFNLLDIALSRDLEELALFLIKKGIEPEELLIIESLIRKKNDKMLKLLVDSCKTPKKKEIALKIIESYNYEIETSNED